MQRFKEQQGEIRKPSTVINAKKQREREKKKKKNGKDQRSLQENQRYQGNISYKDWLNRNGTDLIEAEDIKKRWQEYTGKLYKKDLHDPISTMV